MRIGNPDHMKLFAQVLVFIIALNTVDAVLTVAWVYSQEAVEWNPWMAGLISGEGSVIPFLIVKNLLVMLGCLLLWRLRTRPLAVIGGFLLFLAFYLVFLYHLVMWRQMLDRWMESVFGG